MKVKTATALFAGLILLGAFGEANARPWGRGYGHGPWHRRGPVVVLPVPRKPRPKPVIVVHEPVVRKVVVPASYQTIYINDIRYHYRRGQFYMLRGDTLVQVSAPFGAVVSGLPTGRKLEIIDGKLYYVVGSTYFRKTLGGYRVVACPYRVVKTVPVVETMPVVETAPSVRTIPIAETVEKVTATKPVEMSIPESAIKAVPESDTVNQGPISNSSLQTKYTTWLKNANGSKTPVELIRHPSGTWVGPKGEHYDELPTEEQLRALYGL